MEQNTLSKTASADDLGWGNAHELLQPFGKVASNFTAATRTLISAHESGASRTADTAGASHVLRLIQADSIKATYYYFSKQFKPALFEGKKVVTAQDFLGAYTPIDHAAILALCYLFKTISQKIEKEEWEFVQTPLYEALCAGGEAGNCINEIGLGLGLISRGIRYLAYAPFLYENRKEFKQYRRHLKSIDKPFDANFEQEVWRCSSVQIASILLESMGFPPKMVHQYVAAAERSRSVEPDKTYGIPLRLAECLVTAYMEGEEIPTVTPTWTGIALELDTEKRANLRSTLNKVFSDSLPIEWLNKTTANVTPEEMPELFASSDNEESSTNESTNNTDTPKQSNVNTPQEELSIQSDSPSIPEGKESLEPAPEVSTASSTEEISTGVPQSDGGNSNQEEPAESPIAEVPKVAIAPSSEVTDALDSLNDLDEDFEANTKNEDQS